MTLGLMSADEEQRLRDGGVPIGWGAIERLFAALDAERAAHRNTREYSDCRLADARAAWESIALSWKERALAAEDDAETRCRILQEALQEMLAAFSMGGALSVDAMKRRTDAKKAARAAIEKARGR